MSVGSGPRWVPFPVQDWSTLPADEWRPAPTSPSPGRRWVPWLGVLLTLAVVAGTLVLADRPPATATVATTGAAAYLPPDGQVSYGTRRTQTLTTDTSVTEVTESGTYAGFEVNAALDATLAQQVVPALGLATLRRARFLRTTTTEVGAQGPQRVELLRTDGDVALVASSDADGRRVFVPALELLPADVAVGSRWSGAGTTGAGSYRSHLAAVSAPGDCLLVTGNLTTTESGRTSTAELSRTWCRGRGQQGARTSTGIGSTATLVTTTVQPVGGLADLVPTIEPDTSVPQWAWRSDRWTEHRYDVESVDPQLTALPMTDVPNRATPAVTGSGLLFRAGTGSRDVYALTPRTATGWRTLWRLHPGGSVLSVTAFGDVVVLSTSRRQLVGYDDSGVRLWTYDAGEVVGDAPVRVGQDRIAAVSVGGRVTVLDLRSGRPAWAVEAGTDVGVAPAVVGESSEDGSVVVAAQDGTVSAYAVADGALRWTLATTAASRVVPLGPDRLLVVDDVDLDGVDTATGTRVWRRSVRDSVTATLPLADRVVVATRVGSLVLDRDGTVVARPPAYRQLSSDQAEGSPTVVGWAGGHADVLSVTGTVRSSFPTPVTGLATGGTGLAYRQGVWLFAADWSFRGWSDEP